MESKCLRNRGAAVGSGRRSTADVRMAAQRSALAGLGNKRPDVCLPTVGSAPSTAPFSEPRFPVLALWASASWTNNKQLHQWPPEAACRDSSRPVTSTTDVADTRFVLLLVTPKSQRRGPVFQTEVSRIRSAVVEAGHSYVLGSISVGLHGSTWRNH